MFIIRPEESTFCRFEARVGPFRVVCDACGLCTAITLISLLLLRYLPMPLLRLVRPGGPKAREMVKLSVSTKLTEE